MEYKFSILKRPIAAEIIVEETKVDDFSVEGVAVLMESIYEISLKNRQKILRVLGEMIRNGSKDDFATLFESQVHQQLLILNLQSPDMSDYEESLRCIIEWIGNPNFDTNVFGQEFTSIAFYSMLAFINEEFFSAMPVYLKQNGIEQNIAEHIIDLLSQLFSSEPIPDGITHNVFFSLMVNLYLYPNYNGVFKGKILDFSTSYLQRDHLIPIMLEDVINLIQLFSNFPKMINSPIFQSAIIFFSEICSNSEPFMREMLDTISISSALSCIHEQSNIAQKYLLDSFLVLSYDIYKHVFFEKVRSLTWDSFTVVLQKIHESAFSIFLELILNIVRNDNNVLLSDGLIRFIEHIAVYMESANFIEKECSISFLSSIASISIEAIPTLINLHYIDYSSEFLNSQLGTQIIQSFYRILEVSPSKEALDSFLQIPDFDSSPQLIEFHSTLKNYFMYI